jgi:hypothetical protein
LTTIPSDNVKIKGRAISNNTTLRRKTPRNIRALFISTIGPKTKKLKIEPVEKLLRKDNATNESTVEQMERTKASSIRTMTERTGPPPKAMRLDWGTIVCIAAASKEPIIK